ncbi:MAG: HepT-like ribonuclease domain-containing protein [Actinomycetota bacterium]
MTEGEAHLAELAGVLAHLERLLGAGKANYDTNFATRLAFQRLWIVAGECAKRYCDASDDDLGLDPWASLWGYRNFLAHRLLSEINDDRVWHETAADLKDLRQRLGPIPR